MRARTKEGEPSVSQTQGHTKNEDEALKLDSVERGKITSIHPVLAELYAKLEIPPFRFPFSGISKKDLLAISQLVPILVAKHQGHLRCVGNIRMYRALVAHLSPSEKVFCIDVSGFEESKLIALAISELIYLPPISGIHTSEVEIIGELTRKAAEAKLIPIPPSGTDQFIAKLYGVDRRKVASRTKQAIESIAESTIEKSARSSNRQSVFEVRQNGKLLGHFAPAEAISADQLLKQFNSHQLSISSHGSEDGSSTDEDSNESVAPMGPN
jgi:hypothetical protein